MKYLFFLIITGCSLDWDSQYSIDPRLNQFVESFYREAMIRGFNFPKLNLIVRLQKNLASQGEWGVSINGGSNDEQRTILIDQDYFDLYAIQLNQPNRIEPLMFHELGHSILGRHHNNCNSLMNPQWLGGGDVYENNKILRNNYLDELFGISKCQF